MEKSKRLLILEKSLEKKEAKFDTKINAHFADVKSGNGQPMNDKRNGAATLNRWKAQDNSLHNLNKEIEKTRDAIEWESNKIKGVESVKNSLPLQIQDLIESGVLAQWRKYPNTFFVKGIGKARIVWDVKKCVLAHKYYHSIPCPDQRKEFARVFNNLNAELKKASNQEEKWRHGKSALIWQITQ